VPALLRSWYDVAPETAFQLTFTWPVPQEDGVADRPVGVVGAAGLTVTVVCDCVVPPLPVHERVYVVVTAGETETVPPVLLMPGAPLLIEAEVLLVQEAVRLVEPPAVMVAGDEVRDTTGAAEITL
jgi:hypothetical protein